jgi:hypothetical protein
MTKIMAVFGVAAALAFGANVALAGQCPMLVKQLNEEIPKVSDTKKAGEAKKLTAECQKLHDAGKHAESVAKCDEAAKVAGIQLKKKM